MRSGQIYEEAFHSGGTFPRFLERAEAHRQVWHGMSERHLRGSPRGIAQGMHRTRAWLVTGFGSPT